MTTASPKEMVSWIFSNAVKDLVKFNLMSENIVRKYFIGNAITNIFFQLTERSTGERKKTNVSALYFCIGFVLILVRSLLSYKTIKI